MTDITNGDVPETDAEVDAILDAALPTAPAAGELDPTPADAPSDKDGDDADHEAPGVTIKTTLSRRDGKSSRAGNAAWLDEATKNDFDQMLAAFKEARYTRPEISELTDGVLTASAVYRAENGRVHGGRELDVWMALFKAFAEGKLPPSAASLRAPKAEELRARIAELEARLQEVVAVLSNEEAKTVKQLRDVVNGARELLSA